MATQRAAGLGAGNASDAEPWWSPPATAGFLDCITGQVVAGFVCWSTLPTVCEQTEGTNLAQARKITPAWPSQARRCRRSGYTIQVTPRATTHSTLATVEEASAEDEETAEAEAAELDWIHRMSDGRRLKQRRTLASFECKEQHSESRGRLRSTASDKTGYSFHLTEQFFLLLCN